MEHIYRLTYGPYYEEQELGYLTEDKLHNYLEDLFHSILIKGSIFNHLEMLQAEKNKYKIKRQNAIQDMTKYLSILQKGKVNPKYKEAKKEYKKYENIIIDCNRQMKKADMLLEECNKWTADEWLHWADYNWEPIELNVVRSVDEEDD